MVTKSAGPGGLSLAIEGPSKAEITCTDNGDGSCNVKYVPDEPGTLIVFRCLDLLLFFSKIKVKVSLFTVGSSISS